MKIQLSEKPWAELAADVLVVGAYKDGVLGAAAAEVDKALGGHIKAAAKDEMKGGVGETVLVHSLGMIKAKRVLVVGLGKKDAAGAGAARDAMAVASRVAHKLKAEKIASTVLLDLPQTAGTHAPNARAAAEGAQLGPYSYLRYKTGEKTFDADTLTFATAKGSAKGLDREIAVGATLADAAIFARDLVSAPANDCTPTYLAEQAKKFKGLEVKIFEEKDIERMGMGLLLGVSRGSVQPAKFIRILYRPAGAAKDAPIEYAFVGKGITFDTGGINLKPADGIAKMKYDMSGAAAVLAAMRSLPALKPNVSILGLVPCTENMPSGSATKPGDIHVSMAGKTVEIDNTDAEGRLILADALTYGVRQGAQKLVDLATLTGACLIALGRGAAGLMSNNPAWAGEVKAASEAAGERLWELPLYEDYLQLTVSDIADLKNTGGRDGGTITAGLFLQEFVDGTPWVHLDIAPTAWTDKDLPTAVKGATGFGARTLLNIALAASPSSAGKAAKKGSRKAK